MKKFYVFYLMAVLFISGYGCTKKTEETSQKPAETNSAALSGASVTNMVKPPGASGELLITDLTLGTGPEAQAGKTVTVHYTGTLENGSKFDSSKDRNVPFTFALGSGQVIQGWDKGIVGMKVGGKRKLVIPPQLGYGDRGAGRVIPPNATLLFEVELLKVQ